MIVQGIELTSEEFDLKIKEVDNILNQFDDFTSPTYQIKGLKSVNDLFILIKPIQNHYIQALRINWVDIELKVNEL